MDPNWEKFLAMVRCACLRPGLYAGVGSYAAIIHWINGVDCGWALSAGISPLRLMDFSNWLSRRYMIFGPAWSWGGVILHVAGSEARAFEILPTLFEEFSRELDHLDSQTLYDDLKRALIEKYRVPYHQPETSVTSELTISE